MTKLLSQNSKMKKSSYRTFNFGIPAYYSERQKMLTCPKAGSCVALCYARQGAYNFKGVKNAYENRLEETLKDTFILEMNKEIIKNKADVIRIHDSGDFYNREYLNKWLTICENNPSVKFYTYTKYYSLFDNITLPNNLVVILSQGSKEDLDKNKRHALVFETIEELKANDYVDSSEDDSIAWSSANIKIGLIYHGNKKIIDNGFVKL